MSAEPEQWAVELLEAVHDASDMGSACGMVDCPQCKAAALVIQRAFEERERKLREALHDAINAPKGVVPASAEAFYAPALCTFRYMQTSLPNTLRYLASKDAKP